MLLFLFFVLQFVTITFFIIYCENNLGVFLFYIYRTFRMEKTPKNAQSFYCEKCDFKCSKKSNYENHLRTAKHRNRTISNDFSPKNAEYFCECGKRYKARNSLWYHKKKCTYIETSVDKEIPAEPMMEYLLKENLEMKKMMVDMCQKLEPVSNITNNNVNSHNKIFNLNLFLNEQCKDAMNMTEFIESIQLTMEDVLKITEQGQTKGMSNILIDKLSSLDILKRPMHCSDAKKEIIYVKDEDKWKEEAREKPKLRHALDQITKKGIQALPEMDQTPDDYVNTVSELLKDPREDKKIISEVAKKIIVNKG